MKEPFLKNDLFLADVRATIGRGDALRIWWLGQSGFLAQYAGRHILFDPYLSDSLTDKYAGTDRPHVRMTARVVAPEKLGLVDIVTSSHAHTDHLDAATLIPLMGANPDLRVVFPEANRAVVAQRLELPVDAALLRGVKDGQTVEMPDCSFHGVPAAHNSIERDEHGSCRCLGYVVTMRHPMSSVLSQAGLPVLPSYTIYHSGDTLLYDGMVERLARWKIDVALLPINGDLPERRVAGNLNGTEAARLGKEIGARVVIPCHYDMFEFNTASPDEFVEECDRVGQPYVVLNNGEKWSSDESPIAA